MNDWSWFSVFWQDTWSEAGRIHHFNWEKISFQSHFVNSVSLKSEQTEVCRNCAVMFLWYSYD